MDEAGWMWVSLGVEVDEVRGGDGLARGRGRNGGG